MCLELSASGVPELFAAYAKAQADMGDVLKTANNPAFRTKYADLAAVVEAVLPALSKHGLALIQAPGFDGEVVTVETVIAHIGGGFMRSTIQLRPTKSDPQGLGSAITYGRRYALMAMAGVAPEDDDGNASSGPVERGHEPQKFTPKPPTLSERAATFEATLKGAASDPAKLERTFKLGAGLCADLDAKDPERLAEITSLYERLQETPAEVFA